MESLPVHNPSVSLTNDADHTGKEGYAVDITSQEFSLVSQDDTLVVFGVIVEGNASGEKDSVAPLHTGVTTKVKLAASPGTVNIGTELGTHTDASFKATASTKNACAIALEAGAANELIDALLIAPKITA